MSAVSSLPAIRHGFPFSNQSGRTLMYGQFSPDEMSLLKSFRGPEQIQQFLDNDLQYDPAQTCRSPRRVLRERLADCAEGAFFAAAALEAIGHPPLIIDLEAVRDDDHLVAVFRQHGCWGAVAQSHFAGLRFREPVYRTLGELVMSYYEHYFNEAGEKTLRTFSRPVNLTRFDPLQWRTTEAELWDICEYLCTIPHTRLLPPDLERRRRTVDQRLFAAGRAGLP